eukprot:Blabericola_migrator_1__13243@NODE_91_length_14555_cov_140_209277_g81_i0_p6_GENE_NODE_91_length_14555_cov_140_209277_g81_i0NODE_91_length_14555_cov_140_209277_g81_i0_p6_ORF_typecomplete_len233_score23_48eIF5_eIF2B/PF01873_17/1_9e35Lar_restr_allev/PF14354_6/0_055Elf1/PF05129_13/3_9e02Elf1/PF05129_13/0_44_NODE_91_length_14555_cov_140_209277_g81_i01271413412
MSQGPELVKKVDELEPGVSELVENVDPDAGDGEAGFGKKKKKKRSKKTETQYETNDGTFVDGSGQVFVPGNVYPYAELLSRIQYLIRKHNPDLQGNRKYTIKPPQVSRVGSRRVAWTNFKEICSIMQRSQEHVCQFVLAELGTEGSIAGEGQLVLKGRYGPKHIESLLRKYITEYVTCSMCRSPQTTLERDSRTRLYTISCAACGANRSVSVIKSGFHAVSRADRRKAKQAQ